MKPGFRTTEFWMSMFSQVLGIATLCGAFTPDGAAAVMGGMEQMVGGAMMAIPAFGYALSRGKAKTKE